MPVRAYLPGYRWFHVFRNAAVRIGVYTSVCLALVFSAWLLLANRLPLIERLAVERNLVAAALLCLCALIPMMRFLTMPGHQLASGLVAWLLFSSYYRVLCFFFRNLSDWHSTFQVFMIGAVVYLIVATLSWVTLTIWRAREAHASHPHNHAS
jgi:cytochrome bd-type quinol oxidase subunit 2